MSPIVSTAALPALLLWLLLSAAGCSPQKPPAAGPATAPPASHSVASVPGPEGLQFALAAGVCQEGRCPAALQLVREPGGQVVDSAPLGLAASSAELRREEGETGLTALPPLPAWTAGQEEGGVTTALRSVALSAGHPGVLVYQAAGFEHIKRRYDLFGAAGGKLRRLWSAEEAQGPVWSGVEVVANAAGGDSLLFLQGRRGTDNVADELQARRLRWNAEMQAVGEEPKVAALAVRAGDFATPAAARKARDAAPCLHSYWVLPASDVGGGASRRFVLVNVAGTEAASQTELNRKCGGANFALRSATFRP